MLSLSMMMIRPILLCLVLSTPYHAFNNDAFSLSAYQRARAKETSQSLDASRFHFQILFVDNNNFHGRIAEGIFSRVLEYNDALFALFPASCTITTDHSPQLSNAPLDAAAPDVAVAVCESLDLCSTVCTAMGTSFDMSYLDEYDLIIATDDEIRSLILRSLPTAEDQQSYGPKCRLLSEFWSSEFCSIHSKSSSSDDGPNSLLDMLDWELRERAAPFCDLVLGSSSNLLSTSATTTWADVREPRMIQSKGGAIIPNTHGWPLIEAAMVLASAGLTKFCLDTMDVHMDDAFQSLLEQHFYKKKHLEYTFYQADEQLRPSSVSGYFSLEQRRSRFEQHLQSLRSKLN